MRSRDVVGKTVKRVVQRRLLTPYGWIYEIRYVEFTDGSLMYFNAVPTEDDPVVEGATMTVRERKRRQHKG